jgi:protein SCO1/2
MPVGSARRAAVLGLALLFAALRPGSASAHEAAISGLVLGLVPDKGEAIVRYDAFDGIPAAAATFKLEPSSLARTLKVGQRISATADADEKPMSLSDVRVLGSEALTGAPEEPSALPEGVLRQVVPLDVGNLVPSTPFIDQLGHPFSFDSLRGSTAVLAFIYTRCRDARECPLISSNFHVLQEKLRGENVHLVEVTLDPGYDRPEVLAAYGRQFGADPARWTLATGDPERVLDFAAQFGVSAFPDPRVGVIHSERTVLIDRDGAIRQLIDEVSWSPDELVAQIRADERLGSNPFERFNLWLSAKAVAICGNGVAGFSGFSDLLIVIAIFAGFGWLLWFLARKMARGAT